MECYKIPGNCSIIFSGNDAKIQTNTKYSRIACVLVLLFRVSHGACNTYSTLNEEPVPNNALELLTGKECLNALLDYVERCKRPWGRVARILARILRSLLSIYLIKIHLNFNHCMFANCIM